MAPSAPSGGQSPFGCRAVMIRWPRDPLGRQLLEPQGFHGPEQPTRTFPSWAPIRALDSLYVRGDLDLIDLAGSRQRGSRTASDHLPLIARLHLRDRN